MAGYKVMMELKQEIIAVDLVIVFRTGVGFCGCEMKRPRIRPSRKALMNKVTAKYFGLLSMSA